MEIEDLRHAVPGEDMVAAANAFGEAQMSELGAEIVEADVRVRSAAEDAIQGLRDLAHGRASPISGASYLSS